MMSNHFSSNVNFRADIQPASNSNLDGLFRRTTNVQLLPPREQQGPSASNQHSFQHIPPQKLNLPPPPPPPPTSLPPTSSVLNSISCESDFRNSYARTYQMDTHTNTQPNFNAENESVRWEQPLFGNSPMQQPNCDIGTQPPGSSHSYSDHIQQPFHNYSNQSHHPIQRYGNQYNNNIGNQPFRFGVNCPPMMQNFQPRAPFQPLRPPVMQPSGPNIDLNIIQPDTKSCINDEKSSLNLTAGSEKSKSHEDQWINHWMQRVRARVDKESKNTYPPNLKIFDIQKKLVKYATLVRELDSIVGQLSVVSRQPNQQEWEISVEKSQNLKKELEDLRRFFSGEETVSRIKEMLSKRRDKRRKWREGREKRAKLKLKLREERKNKERDIDDMLKKLHNVEKEKLQEEKMKKEADSVLREVRTKQEEVTKMQKLLEGLSKLREIRKKKGEMHGYVEDPCASAFFDKMKSEFDGLLSEQQDLYHSEEQALKIMMEESRTTFPPQPRKDSNQPLLHLPELKKSLSEIYFGKTESQVGEYQRSFLAAEESVEILVKRRKDWDQYIVSNDDPRGSSVPVGWVVPNSDPQEVWKQFHQNT